MGIPLHPRARARPRTSDVGCICPINSCLSPPRPRPPPTLANTSPALIPSDNASRKGHSPSDTTFRALENTRCPRPPDSRRRMRRYPRGTISAPCQRSLPTERLLAVYRSTDGIAAALSPAVASPDTLSPFTGGLRFDRSYLVELIHYQDLLTAPSAPCERGAESLAK